MSDPDFENIDDFLAEMRAYRARWDHRFLSWLRVKWCGLWGHKVVRGGRYPDADGIVYWYECSCGENSGSN